MTTLQEALATPGCERLLDFYNVGPVQRAAVESFAAALAQKDDSLQANYLKSELAHTLAQQAATKNCPQPEICGSKECEFCRDTAAPKVNGDGS